MGKKQEDKTTEGNAEIQTWEIKTAKGEETFNCAEALVEDGVLTLWADDAGEDDAEPLVMYAAGYWQRALKVADS